MEYRDNCARPDTKIYIFIVKSKRQIILIVCSHSNRILSLYITKLWPFFMGFIDSRIFVLNFKANLKTFDIWHSNRSCCLINGSDTGHWRNMTCFSVDDLNRSWQIPLPKLINQLKCKCYGVAFYCLSVAVEMTIFSLLIRFIFVVIAIVLSSR